MTMSADEISQVYASEQHDAKVTRASQVPPSYDSITPEWLTDVLCKNTPGAKVLSHRLDKRDDGSANRRRIFISYNEAGTAAGLPSKVFCKAAESLQNRIVLGVSGAGKAETDFYSKVRPLVDIETPVAYYAAYDPANQASLTMMRDIGDEVTFCDERTEMTLERVRSQISLLAKLHSRFYMKPELGTDAIPFRTWDKWWADMMVGDPQYPEYCDLAFGDCESIMPSRLFKRRAEVWPATNKSAERIKELPLTLVHNDVHLKNWYIRHSGEMGIGDWQCVSIGHWSRDLAYVITSALTVEDRRAWEKMLVSEYLDQMEALGVPRVSDNEAWTNMRQQLFSVLSFWTITLRPTPGMPLYHPERTTYEFLRRMLIAIDDHDALDSFS